MQTPKQIAMRIVCQSSNGGNGGVATVVVTSEAFLIRLLWSNNSKTEVSFPKRLRGSGSQGLMNVVELNA